MYIQQDTQSQIFDIPFAEFIFDGEHPLLKLSHAIHWENLLGYLKQFYSSDRGRPSIPMRAQVGTLILKFLKNLPDRKAVEYVHESIYAQRFCGLLPSQVKDYMHPATGLSNFRSRIGPQGMAFIQEVLTCAGQKKSLKKGDKLILDTTCVPVDILYPTDIRLLERPHWFAFPHSFGSPKRNIGGLANQSSGGRSHPSDPTSQTAGTESSLPHLQPYCQKDICPIL